MAAATAAAASLPGGSATGHFRVVVEEVVPQVHAVPAAVLGEHRQLHERGDAPEDAEALGQSHGVKY